MEKQNVKALTISVWIILALIILNWILLFTVIPAKGSYGTRGLNLLLGGLILIVPTILSIISVAIPNKTAKFILGILSLLGLLVALPAQFLID